MCETYYINQQFFTCVIKIIWRDLNFHHVEVENICNKPKINTCNKKINWTTILTPIFFPSHILYTGVKNQ